MAQTLQAHAETSTAPSRESIVDELDNLMVRLFAMVSQGLRAATEAFLGGDRDVARGVVAGDRHVDDLSSEVEGVVERRLVDLDRIDAHEVRRLVSILRIAPELERSGDLIEHIALRTPQRLAEALTPRARALLQDMGTAAADLWEGAADAYIDRDPRRVDQLRRGDDLIDDLHVELTEELTRGTCSVAQAIELGLIARFYERLGDHAVNVARRIGYLVDG